MSKKPKTRTMRVEVPEWEPEKMPDQELDREDAEMEQIARSLPGGLRCINLYRMQSGSQGGRPRFVADLPPEQFKESLIQQTYGGGSYFARWQKKDGGMIRYTFDIEGPEKKLDVEEGEDEPQTIVIPPQTVPATQGFDPLSVFKMMQEAEDRGARRMEKMIELMRPQAQSPDVTKQVFDIVEKIAPLMGGGEGGGGNTWLSLATMFKEPLTKLADSIHAATSRPAPVPVPVQAPRPSVPSVPSTPQPSFEVKEEDMFHLVLRQYLPILVNAARKNSDPGFYADLVLEQIPENLYPRLKDFLSRPDCLMELTKFEPGIQFQAEWWESLRAEVLAGMEPNAGIDVQPSATSSEPGENR